MANFHVDALYFLTTAVPQCHFFQVDQYKWVIRYCWKEGHQAYVILYGLLQGRTLLLGLEMDL